MDEDSKVICSFNQRLSYDDIANYFNYMLKSKDINKIKKRERVFGICCAIGYFIIVCFLIFAMANGTLGDILIWIFILLSFILISNLSVEWIIDILLLAIKYFSKGAKQNKITIFEDYILYEGINGHKKPFKALIKDIEEIDKTPQFVLITVNKKMLLVSLLNDNTKVQIMLDYLHKVCGEKFNYGLTKQSLYNSEEDDNINNRKKKKKKVIIIGVVLVTILLIGVAVQKYLKYKAINDANIRLETRKNIKNIYQYKDNLPSSIIAITSLEEKDLNGEVPKEDEKSLLIKIIIYNSSNKIIEGTAMAWCIRYTNEKGSIPYQYPEDVLDGFKIKPGEFIKKELYCLIPKNRKIKAFEGYFGIPEVNDEKFYIDLTGMHID